MDSREAGMRTGAAFNQAVQLVAGGIVPIGAGDVVGTVADTAADLAYAAGDLQDALMGAGRINVAQAPTTVAQAQANVEAAFPGTTVVSEPAATSFGPELIGGDGSPAPAWLIDAAAKDGCTKVYDNRADAVGTNKPWFRAADDTVFKSGRSAGKPVAYWPPKN